MVPTDVEGAHVNNPSEVGESSTHDLEVGEQQQQQSHSLLVEDAEETAHRERQRRESRIDTNEEDFARCARFCLKHDCCFRCLKHRPGAFAILFGVIVPLWFLIALSMFFGFFLAKLEAPHEIQNNDEYMAARASQEILESLVANFTRVIPWACFELYLESNRTYSGREIFSQLLNITLDFNMTLLESDLTQVLGSGEVVIVNSTEMFEFMRACGNQAAPVVEYVVETLDNITSNTSDLTFNWVRCTPDTLGQAFQGNPVSVFNPDMNPDAQADFYIQLWNDRRASIYQSLIPPGGFKSLNERLEAEQKSIDEASGEYGCTTNIPASAWFWFTVMTTIGYGNQAPSTTGGRTMVYTLGFGSILGFAAILARAGRIVNVTFDRFLAGNRLKWLTFPLASSLFWGCAYYSWMLMIAQQIQNWKIERLGEPFSFRDAYWFSYVSTTTVGLGDIFLEPEVLTTSDLLVFPTLFLIGFTYLSAFLGKFKDFVVALTMTHRKKSIVEFLLEQMQKEVDEAESSQSARAFEEVSNNT